MDIGGPSPLNLTGKSKTAAVLRIANHYRFTTDAADWKEHEHPRDEDGKFSSGQVSVIHSDKSYGVHLVHDKKTDLVHTIRHDLGGEVIGHDVNQYDPASSDHRGKYLGSQKRANSVQANPEIHKALGAHLGNVPGHETPALAALRPVVPTNISPASQNRLAGYLAKIDAARNAPDPLVALDAIKINPAFVRYHAYQQELIAHYLGGGAKPQPVQVQPQPTPTPVKPQPTPTPQPAPVKPQPQPTPGQSGAVAAAVRPVVPTNISDSSRKRLEGYLGKLDAATKSSDPVAALQAVYINPAFVRYHAYQQALVKQYSGGATPQPTPQPTPVVTPPPKPTPTPPKPTPTPTPTPTPPPIKPQPTPVPSPPPANILPPAKAVIASKTHVDEQRYHEHAFPDLATNTRVLGILHNTPPLHNVIKLASLNDSSSFSRQEVRIKMRNIPNQNEKAEVWRHEYGHAIDSLHRKPRADGKDPPLGMLSYQLVGATNANVGKTDIEVKFYGTPESTALADDVRDLHKRNPIMDNGPRPGYTHPVTHDEAEQRLSKYGLTVEDVLGAGNTFGRRTSMNTGAPLPHRLDNALHILEQGTLYDRTNSISMYQFGYHDGSNSHPQGNNFMDFIGSATMNKVGLGHQTSYYKSSPERSAIETFANYFSLSHGPSTKVYKKLMHTLLPRTSAKFEEALDNIAVKHAPTGA